MNALTLSVLAWYYVNTKEYLDESPAAIDAHHYLQRNGLIDLDVDGVWMTTEKAEVLIKYWCETPLPVAAWKIPGREENQE